MLKYVNIKGNNEHKITKNIIIQNKKLSLKDLSLINYLLIRKALLFSILLFLLSFLLLIPNNSYSLPSGATVNNLSTETAPAVNPGSLTNERSTINTILLTAVQQDQRWKAYVGNVSGQLTLDDADGNTIYDWSLTGTIDGEVYASRSNSITFTSVACASAGTISNEESAVNMTGSEADSISNTFNYTAHKSFYVGATQISADSCPSTATYINSASQTPSSTATFQEILLQDGSNNLIYVAPINDNQVGFDGSTYDFQMIVAESDINVAPYTYYFYLELS